jgi:pilus assembly protein CpaE
MKRTDLPVPSEEHHPSDSNALSLEQLLSLRPAVEQKTSERESRAAVVKKEQSEEQEEHTTSFSSSNAMEAPLWMVVHERWEGGQTIKTKLHHLTSEARIQWVSIHSQVIEQVLEAQPQVVVIQFINSHLDLAAQIAAQLQEIQPHVTILALGSPTEPQCMLAALRAGVKEFLDINGSEEDWCQSIANQLQKRPPIIAHSSDISTSLTAVVSARAGMGTSLLAAHLAVYIQQALQNNESVDALKIEGSKNAEGETLKALLLDLGAPRGECGLYLDLHSDFDFFEAMQSLRRFDRKLASSGLTKHPSGLRWISLPRKEELPNEWPYAEADMLVQRLQQYFQHIVADLGAVGQADWAMRVVSRAARIWVVCDQSFASVVSTTELLQQFKAKKVDRERIGLIVTRHDRDVELSAQQISEQLCLPLLATVPERRLQLLQAINQGQLLEATARREPYVQAIQKLVNVVLQGQPISTAIAPSVLGRFLKKIRG